MAKVTKATKKVERIVYDETEVYTLELTKNELLAIKLLTGICITTTPIGGYTRDIFYAIENFGLEIKNIDSLFLKNDSPTIIFSNKDFE